jgi:hypothetical protein
VRLYLDHLAENGNSPDQIRGFRCADLEAAVRAEKARGRIPRCSPFLLTDIPGA